MRRISLASQLPLLAKEGGATLIEVNPEETPLSAYADETLRGPAGDILPAWWQRQQHKKE